MQQGALGRQRGGAGRSLDGREVQLAALLRRALGRAVGALELAVGGLGNLRARMRGRHGSARTQRIAPTKRSHRGTPPHAPPPRTLRMLCLHMQCPHGSIMGGLSGVLCGGGWAGGRG